MKEAAPQVLTEWPKIALPTPPNHTYREKLATSQVWLAITRKAPKQLVSAFQKALLGLEVRLLRYAGSAPLAVLKLEGFAWLAHMRGSPTTYMCPLIQVFCGNRPRSEGESCLDRASGPCG